MRIRNKTNSIKQLMDLSTYKLVEVGAWKIIELKKASFNPKAFEIIKERKKKKHIEQKEMKITEKEVI